MAREPAEPRDVSSLQTGAQVVELRPRAKQDFTSSLGMILFLASWAMMFGALLFAYGYLRTRSVVWPPAGMPPLPLAIPTLSTAVLLGSSGTFAKAVGAIGRGRRTAMVRWIAATLALGGTFIGLQLVVWQKLAAAGLYASSGQYGSVFYGLTVFHALHIGFGLVALAWVLVRALLGKYTEHDFVGVRNCAMYWHFMDAVWLLMFVSIYLL